MKKIFLLLLFLPTLLIAQKTAILKGTIKKVATCGQTHSSSICAEAQQLTPDSCSITQYKWCTKNDDFTPLGGTNDDDLITDTNDDVIGGDDSDGSGNPPSDW